MIPFVQSIKQLVLSSSQPIGSIVIRTDNINPSTIYGGTWEQIEDTFLLACGSRYNNGATGGEFTHTLTVEEMPSHTHTFTGTAHSHGLNEHTHTIPAHAHGLNSHTHTYAKPNSPTGAASGNTANSSELTSGKASGNTANATQGGTNSNTGGGQAFNITPKYLAVYVWKRIA